MDYMFNNLGRIGQDKEDNSQRNLQNVRFANSVVSNYFSDSNNTLKNSVNFATKQPTMQVSGMVRGHGLNGNAVDYESLLLLKQEQNRPLEKLSLNPRPFLTVPYLGRGAFEPDVEMSLRRGDMKWEKKSESTVMDKSFMDYYLPPNYQQQETHEEVEEAVMDGWMRGGLPSRAIH